MSAPAVDPVIENWFADREPTEEHQRRSAKLRAAAKQMAYEIKATTPACADQTASLRLLRECLWTARAALEKE